MSEGAWRALERVALAMGAREGTAPEDDPLMRSHSLRAWAKGRAEGLGEARTHERMDLVAATLRARGIGVGSDLATDRSSLGGLSGDALMAAALACTDEADFRRRVRAQLNPRDEHQR